MPEHDFIVIGGGVIGPAVAFGLARLGCDVVLLDEGDAARRAARGNFGLIWVQGKGLGCPTYAQWTRRSAELWPQLAAELGELTGIDLGYRQNGGGHLCLDEAGLADRTEAMARLRDQQNGVFAFETVTGAALADLFPGISSAVAGAIFCPHDGQVDPLALYRALRVAFARRGGHYRPGFAVRRLHGVGDGIEVETDGQRVTGRQVIIAAGLGSKPLAATVGIDLPIAPQRGQLLITERLPPLFDRPTTIVRQTHQGTIQIGDTHEDVGFDHATTLPELTRMAAQAVTCFPSLGRAKVVRGWGCLRIMTPDGWPIYERSADHPSVFAAVAHSGVTLAAAHAYDFAAAMATGDIPDQLAPLSGNRFHV
jgi:glycine/D-amino acid oxidase-like deaminating enzyme